MWTVGTRPTSFAYSERGLGDSMLSILGSALPLSADAFSCLTEGSMSIGLHFTYLTFNRKSRGFEGVLSASTNTGAFSVSLTSVRVGQVFSEISGSSMSCFSDTHDEALRWHSVPVGLVSKYTFTVFEVGYPFPVPVSV